MNSDSAKWNRHIEYTTVTCGLGYWVWLYKISDLKIVVTTVALIEKGEVVNFEPISLVKWAI